MKTSLMMLALIAAGSTVASAGFINPAHLQTSPDGANKNLQSLLTAEGFTTSVVTDQTDTELFQICPRAESMMWEILWQVAGNAPRHKLGWYRPGDEANITWVLGGSSTGLPTSANVSISGLFGLAFQSGDGNSTVYYSQSALNNDGGADHMASLKALFPEASGVCSQVVSWEDLPNLGDKDWNDFGVVMYGTAVPTPGSLALVAAAGVMVAKRRRK
jgi:hypothetical protein